MEMTSSEFGMFEKEAAGTVACVTALKLKKSHFPPSLHYYSLTKIVKMITNFTALSKENELIAVKYVVLFNSFLLLTLLSWFYK